MLKGGGCWVGLRETERRKASRHRSGGACEGFLRLLWFLSNPSFYVASLLSPWRGNHILISSIRAWLLSTPLVPHAHGLLPPCQKHRRHPSPGSRHYSNLLPPPVSSRAPFSFPNCSVFTRSLAFVLPSTKSSLPDKKKKGFTASNGINTIGGLHKKRGRKMHILKWWGSKSVCKCSSKLLGNKQHTCMQHHWIHLLLGY